MLRLPGGILEGIGGINGDGQRLDLRWGTHNTVYRWCVVEFCSWNLYNFVYQCHPNKLNIKEKSVAFLCINNEFSEKEIKTNPIYNTIKTLKYLGINLTKDVKDLYSENY